MESLTNTNGATVYVDYAHNYDSLKNLLTFVREEHPDGRLIVLVGSTETKRFLAAKTLVGFFLNWLMLQS